MTQGEQPAAVIFAAGYGSRVKGFSGNKVLLPLIPEAGPFSGRHSMIVEIIGNLPAGPKTLVVHHRSQEVIEVTRDLGVSYCEQPVPNGTGGALIAAKGFLQGITQERLIITMGDVPFVKRATYERLIVGLEDRDLVVLGFKPVDRAQYGLLEIEGDSVKRITEWRYWREYPLERQVRFDVFNAGIYGAKRQSLLYYTGELEKRPHRVRKERGGKIKTVEEYFITDLVELMANDGLSVGFTVTEEEQEVMGIDTVEDLMLAQRIFAKRKVKRL
ncbi:MAG: NTP transferase domain-containing protein [Deltaproteobacteria bacterium]|nr:NTP transferase domain-containing protein [Deltaproteobacteria bacterium]